MEDAIILYPCPAIGHFISLLELGRFILTHHQGFSIHVVLPAAAAADTTTASYVSGISSSTPAIKFHRLPEPPTPPTPTDPPLVTFGLSAIASSNPLFRKVLETISRTFVVRAIVLDVLCTCALPVAAELNIPAYSYFTSGAGSLLPFLYLPTLHNCTNKSFKELRKTLVHIPGATPVAAGDMPAPMLDRFGQPFFYQFFLDLCIALPKMSGVFVNSFEALEPRAVRTIREGTCVPIGPTPPLYCVGPLLVSPRTENGDVPECVTWLDHQPTRSVLFLCFGSGGTFSRKQLGEIAGGLERSGNRFLWVVRDPPEDQSSASVSLESLIPEGFLERTKERGFVVKSWAPQVMVLNHVAVGGFVTHCGWNSVLEAIRGGVPMVAWPLYAEQRFNRVLLVEEMKVAVPMEEGVDGLVGWAEIEKRAREIMSSDVGELLREKVCELREAAKVALLPGGTSLSNLDKFVSSWKP